MFHALRARVLQLRPRILADTRRSIGVDGFEHLGRGALRHGDLDAVVVIAGVVFFFTPLPRRRKVCPPCVPAGMRARTGP